MKLSENEYMVDGILLKKEDGCLIMSFKVGGMEHLFRIQTGNAVKMAEIFSKLFLERN